MAAWGLSDDTLAFGPLRLAVQRIPMSHWRAEGKLRSWGPAPLFRKGNDLFAPCAGNEAVWLGAWLEDSSGTALVQVQDPVSGNRAEIKLPDDYQISALHCDEPRSVDSLTIGDRLGGRAYRMVIHVSDAVISMDLNLLPPGAWSRLAQRSAPDPLDKPPPLPPLLG